MNGMEMMIPHLIKGLGLDPEKIKEVLSDATIKVKQFDAKLDAIQASLQRIELKLNTLPDEELARILASKTPEQIAKELEEVYGRNGNGDDHN